MITEEDTRPNAEEILCTKMFDQFINGEDPTIVLDDNFFKQLSIKDIWELVTSVTNSVRNRYNKNYLKFSDIEKLFKEKTREIAWD